MNFKTLKNIWTAAIILLALTIFFTIIFSDNKVYNSLYENEINGVINAIRYGDRKETIVKIKDQEYSLSLFGIRKGEDVNIGDSLYKTQKSTKLELHSKAADGGFIFTEIYLLKDP